MFLKIYITVNKNNNFHYVIIDKTGRTLFKKSYGCVDKSSKLRLHGINKLINLAASFIETQQNAHVMLLFRGSGIQRFLFLKEFMSRRFLVTRVFYVSQKAFNGCRKKKQRRLLINTKKFRANV